MKSYLLAFFLFISVSSTAAKACTLCRITNLPVCSSYFQLTVIGAVISIGLNSYDSFSAPSESTGHLTQGRTTCHPGSQSAICIVLRTMEISLLDGTELLSSQIPDHIKYFLKQVHLHNYRLSCTVMQHYYKIFLAQRSSRR